MLKRLLKRFFMPPPPPPPPPPPLSIPILTKPKPKPPEVDYWGVPINRWGYNFTKSRQGINRVFSHLL